jgi:hypothetical protein
MRSFRKHQILVEDEIHESELEPQIDTVAGLSKITNLYMDAAFPFMCGSLTYFLPYKLDEKDVLVNWCYPANLLFGVITFFFINLQVFVSVNIGGLMWRRFITNFFHYGSIFIYILLPIFSMTWVSLLNCFSHKLHDNFYFTYNILYLYVCLGYIISYIREVAPRNKRMFQNL